MKPSFVDIYMEMAFLVSKRSCDPRTKHGCIFTTLDNRLISSGYNGVMEGVDENEIPNQAPDKYSFYLHAEKNAILNCSKIPRDIGGAIAYVTGYPCIECLNDLYQFHVRQVYWVDRRWKKMEDPEYKYWEKFDIFEKAVVYNGNFWYKVLPMKEEWERHL